MILSVVEELAKWAYTASDTVPPTARHAARRLVLDQVGIAHAGAIFAGTHSIQNLFLGRAGNPKATDWVTRRSAYAPYVALGNRCVGDALELAAGPECVASAMAAAEVADRSFGDLLRAIAVAAEIDQYVRSWLGEGAEQHGLHAPAMLGTLSAATAAGVALRLHQDDLAGALSGAMSLTPCSPYVSFSHGASGKTLYGGWSQMLGLSFALWGATGMHGPASVLEGNRAVGQALLDADDSLEPPKFQPEAWAITAVTFKRYPCNRACHPALTALESIGLPDVSSVKTIDVFTYPYAVALDRRSHGLSPTAAQMNIRRTLALALVRGGLDFAAYTPEILSDPRIADLEERITVEVDPSYVRSAVRVRRARIRVTFVNGRIVEAESGPQWGQDCPATDDELYQRFLTLTVGCDAFNPWFCDESTPVRQLVGGGEGG
jgi:2-methylcitrate dehydratase PrpD